jgi:hypothetical protein
LGRSKGLSVVQKRRGKDEQDQRAATSDAVMRSMLLLLSILTSLFSGVFLD